MKPKKHLGQHFLKNKFYLNLIAKSLEIKKEDVILELGAGGGNLTCYLQKAKKIIAIEIDKNLVEILKRKKIKNLKIISEDLRKLDLNLLIKKYQVTKICGNIPYYLSGFLLREILELKTFPQLLVFLLQKEVGQKIIAKNKKENFLSIAFKLVGEPKIIATLKKELFFPPPKIDSVILKINFFKKQKPLEFRTKFYKFLKLGFLHPNKFLISNLAEVYPKEKLKEIFRSQNLSLKSRAHQLSLDHWLLLFKKLQRKTI